MDSFPRFTRSALFKELLVQDLDGKQLPVLDITPAPQPESTSTQDVNDSTKNKAVTRTSSTKVSLTIDYSVNSIVLDVSIAIMLVFVQAFVTVELIVYFVLHKCNP